MNTDGYDSPKKLIGIILAFLGLMLYLCFLIKYWSIYWEWIVISFKYFLTYWKIYMSMFAFHMMIKIGIHLISTED